MPLLTVVVVDVEGAGAPGAEDAVGLVGGVVAGAGAGAWRVVVEVVSSPRRYLPSSVPPQPAPSSARVAARAAVADAVRRTNRHSPIARCGNAAAY